jgi:hypothetical protein
MVPGMRKIVRVAKKMDKKLGSGEVLQQALFLL